MSTASVAEPKSGSKLYQERARRALPLLVRQAQSGRAITYKALAEELGMPNPRNVNYVLGSIGQTLALISAEWEVPVPRIQSLVVNKSTGLPGEGISEFMGGGSEYKDFPLGQRWRLVNAELGRVFAFHRWNEVLSALFFLNRAMTIMIRCWNPRETAVIVGRVRLTPR